jgi:starch phosphorylase
MGGASETRDGEADTVHAVDELSRRLPIALRPLAQVAYNYWWAWSPPAAGLWEAIDPTRWERCGRNPVRLLQEVSQVRLEELAGDGPFLGRLGTVAREFQQHMTIRGDGAPGASVPIAYLSAEFGVHSSLPFYAGGLGVLAGDFLKAASDDEIDVVGVSLFYSQGSFHQRLDISGWQHEYWLATDSDRLPAVLVSDSGGGPLTVQLSVRGHDVRLQIWRVNVGRTRLYLLDSDRAENSLADRWITSRLYVGDRETRLAQYAVLGIGGVRALRAMGIEPRAFHLNEGHAALALLELIGERVRAGVSPEDAMAATHDITVFTTHTPWRRATKRSQTASSQPFCPTCRNGRSWTGSR